MARTIRRVEQLMRQQGGAIPLWTNVADWCDAVVLVANTAQNYLLKTDAQTPAMKGTKLRINYSVGPVYMNPNAAATIPGASTSDGSSSIMIGPCAAGGTFYMVFPVDVAVSHTTLSFICGAASVLTIEAFD